MFSSFNLNLYEMETLNGPWLKKISQGSSCSELVDASSFNVRLHGALRTSSICRGPCSLQRSWLRWSLRPKQLLNSHLLKSSLSPFLKVFPSLLPSSTLHLPAMSLAAGCSVVFLTCSALCSHECPPVVDPDSENQDLIQLCTHKHWLSFFHAQKYLKQP